MKKHASLIFLLLVALFSFAQNGQVPANAAKLISAYNNVIEGYKDNYIVFKDGTKMIWDDGVKNKSYKDLLGHPDLKDMFTQKYTDGLLKKSRKKTSIRVVLGMSRSF